MVSSGRIQLSDSQTRSWGLASASAAMRYVGSVCLVNGPAMRTGTSEPPRQGIVDARGVGPSGEYRSRYVVESPSNPHAYPPMDARQVGPDVIAPHPDLVVLRCRFVWSFSVQLLGMLAKGG
jgi:hypothetical protein